jgi:hypothetical protein
MRRTPAPRRAGCLTRASLLICMVIAPIVVRAGCKTRPGGQLVRGAKERGETVCRNQESVPPSSLPLFLSLLPLFSLFQSPPPQSDGLCAARAIRRAGRGDDRLADPRAGKGARAAGREGGFG